MSRLDRIKRRFMMKKIAGLTTGDVEGTTRDWEDVYEDGRVTRSEYTRDGEYYDSYDVTEEYED